MTAPIPRRSARPSELDDLTVRRAQAGDERAFRALVERYQRPVWELCWRLLAPVGLAHKSEDLAQDTLLRVYRALPTFDPRGAARLSTWIFTIATRLTLNELRRARPEPHGADDDFAAPPTASPAHRIERSRLGERLAAAVAELPAGARAVLILRDVFELPYDDVARALEVDLGTVKSRLHRARAAVRARLTADEVTP